MNDLIFALPGNDGLARTLALATGGTLGESIFRRFPDGETYLRFLTPVRHHRVVLACTLDHPDEKLIALYLAARTLRDLGAAQVVLVAPYLPYMRQDTVFAPGEGISARHVAALLSGCVDALVTVDPHLHRVQNLEQLYRIPLRVVPAAPAIATWLKREVRQPLLVGPDDESRQWVAAIARLAGCEYRVMRKQRYGDRSVHIDAGAFDGLAGCTPVLIDDIVSSGGTFVESLRVLAAQRMPAAICVAVHGLFAGRALEDLRAAGAVRVRACNTVRHGAEPLDVGGDLASAVVALLRERIDPGQAEADTGLMRVNEPHGALAQSNTRQ